MSESEKTPRDQADGARETTIEVPAMDESTVEMTAVPETDSSAGGDQWKAAYEEQRDKHLRLAAEFENFRKRAIRERSEAGASAQAEIIKSLVDVLDDISRFAHVNPVATDATTVVEGVALVEKKAIKALTGHGLTVVNPVDEVFDPAVHEAVGTEPAANADEDHLVSKVYQAGYVWRGQLLRPARVVVRQWNG